MKDYKNAVLVAALLLGAGAVSASIIETTDFDTTDHDIFVANRSGSDLINTGQATLLSSSGTDAYFGSGWYGTDGLNDGASSDGLVSGLGKTFYLTSQLPATNTFLLNTSVNTLGYTLTSIDTYAGFGGDESSQANQQYKIFVSTIGDETFTSLAEVNYTPFTATDTDEQAATIVTLTDTMGALATGVDAIRFVFAPNLNEVAGGNGGTVYQEIDVMGQAVPEPLVLSFVGLVGIGSLVIRRFHS